MGVIFCLESSVYYCAETILQPCTSIIMNSILPVYRYIG